MSTRASNRMPARRDIGFSTWVPYTGSQVGSRPHSQFEESQMCLVTPWIVGRSSLMNNASSSANGPPSESLIDARGSHEIQFAQRSLAG
jgi:hypothetical protein